MVLNSHNLKPRIALKGSKHIQIYNNANHIWLYFTLHTLNTCTYIYINIGSYSDSKKKISHKKLI